MSSNELRYGRSITITRQGQEPVEFEPGLGPFTAAELGRPPTDAGARDIAVRVASLYGVAGRPVLGGVTSTDPEFAHRPHAPRRTDEHGHVLGGGFELPGVIGADEEVGPGISVTVEITDSAGVLVGSATIGDPL